MPAFCDYPAGHGVHLRTASPVGPTFATARHQAEFMTLALHLDDTVAAALAAEAARHGQTADQLAAALLTPQLPKPVTAHRRLSFAAISESTSGRSAADDPLSRYPWRSMLARFVPEK